MFINSNVFHTYMYTIFEMRTSSGATTNMKYWNAKNSKWANRLTYMALAFLARLRLCKQCTVNLWLLCTFAKAPYLFGCLRIEILPMANKLKNACSLWSIRKWIIISAIFSFRWRQLLTFVDVLDSFIHSFQCFLSLLYSKWIILLITQTGIFVIALQIH